jgi:Flp pilus assembly pilin Flp
MTGVMSRAREFVRSDDAATAVEYSVMLALVLLAVIIAIEAFGTRVSTLYTDIETAAP